MLKNEQKIFKKWNTRYNYRKFAQFYELVKFIIGPKLLVIGPFRCTTYVDSDKNILEPFCTKMHSDAMRLTDQSRVWSGISHLQYNGGGVVTTAKCSYPFQPYSILWLMAFWRSRQMPKQSVAIFSPSCWYILYINICAHCKPIIARYALFQHL